MKQLWRRRALKGSWELAYYAIGAVIGGAGGLLTMCLLLRIEAWAAIGSYVLLTLLLSSLTMAGLLWLQHRVEGAP